MLFSGHISTSSLMSINYSILEYIVQKVILKLETQFPLHNSLCDVGRTSDFEVPNAQANTFRCHINENLVVSKLCYGVAFQSG